MKQFITLLTLASMLAVYIPTAMAYDFSSVAPSGQTLYYNIVDGNAEVTYPNYCYYEPGLSYYYYYNFSLPVGDLVIPSTVIHNGTTYTVTSIGNYAFLERICIASSDPNHYYGSQGLTSVSIPNTITTIGDYAFANCGLSGLLTIPNSVTSIGGYAFHGCTGLTGTLTIPNSVTSIGSCAFYGCTGLTGTLTIPNSVTSIGDYAFLHCSGLTSVTIGNSVNSIGGYAFYGCTGLTGTLTIPNSVTSIYDAAFGGCTGLTSLTIPNSVTSIGSGAFSGCTGITEIHSHAYVAPTLDNDAFNGVTRTIPVYIPCGASGSYYGRWSYFSNLIEDEAFSFSAVSADNNMGTVQILTMPTCTSPQAVIYASPNSGYRFDHWSDGNTANPYSLTITEDTELIGYFVPDGGPNVIDDVETADNIKIYTRSNTIVIDFSGQQVAGSGQTVVVYDVMGRVIKQAADSGQQTAVEIPVTAAGVYMVKVGDQPSRKVVVRP